MTCSKLCVRVCGLAVLFAMMAMASVGSAAEWEPLFNGKDLSDWKGKPEFWRVEDDAITGETTKEKPTNGNTFIIWQGGEIGDFELKLKYRIFGGNSGIQYRSFEVEPGSFVVGGYQADFEAGKTWSGTNYGEKFRGVLAKRGDKVVFGKDGKPKTVGKVGDSAELQKQIKDQDWNEYHIIADGFTFTQKINGHVMSVLTDEHEAQRRAKGILALQLHAGPPMKVQFKDIQLKRTGKDDTAKSSDGGKDKKKICFVAGTPSHGYGSHEHNAGCMLLAKCLNESGLPVEAVVHKNGWPKDASFFDGADAIVMYCDGGGGHFANQHLDQINALANKGVGIGCIHYGVETVKGAPGDRFLDWTGGYFEKHWSVNPHWVANYEKLPDHPATRGVKPFAINDEWYYHMRFRPEMKGVTPLLTTLPPKQSLSRPDGGHSGNPEVRKAVLERKEPQHMAWCSENENGSRGFGFTGGHFHWNWGHPDFRKLVLNAILWTAHADVPAEGVPSSVTKVEELTANQDEKTPGNFKAAEMQKQLDEWNGKAATSSESTKQSKAPAWKKLGKKLSRSTAIKPLFKSDVITKKTPGRAVEIDIPIKGAKQLVLIANDGGDSHSCDWAAWAEPRLVGPQGEQKLTELKWKSAQSGHGQVVINKNCNRQAILVDGKPVGNGIGTHANSTIVFDLPGEYERFKARACLDDGGANQSNCGDAASVQFLVYDQVPSGPKGDHSADDALAGLDVGEGLAATLFSAEPMITNPSNIDIDHRGRVWVCEIVNYRNHRNQRAEGDRIVILEDTDSDGVADKDTVFYQGKDIDSPHGICVLATRDGKNTKAIVSVGSKVIVLTDVDGDDKADKREVLFTGIGGTQHDHGIHAFVFGPDGKLYFNFGNNGGQIKDAAGKPIVDKAGNTVAATRKPYQEGMVFRCNLDGSEFETLGWNFRNNWMATVDSFGTVWQSDNDDDGNRGVRINYVMEFGNYGYKDEKTGAGWNAKRTNLEKEIPLRHWHLNDPGVVPNLLQTGAGSPTGITVYEGDLLPKQYQGQVIHTDAGPNVCRAYPVENDGAGYKATIENILVGTRDKWYRPSDVSVAPDGSLIIADWYDPGVGGHRAGDLTRGRLFRITPDGHDGNYTAPKFDFSTADGAVEALKSPNYAARYIAWQTLHGMGDKAEPALTKLWQSENPRYRARALWLLGKIEGKAQQYADAAIADKDADIRISGIRLARQTGVDVAAVAKKLVKDPSPQVRREVAVALRHLDSAEVPKLWAELAAQHDGQDRWYLEALGIAADGRWDECLAAWQQQVGDGWNTAAGRDIIWRSRAKQTPKLLAEIIKTSKPADHARYMRAFDFLSGPEKDAALKSILGL